MGYMAIKWAREQRVGNPTGKSILVDLAIRSNDEGVCWPSQQTISDATDASIRTVNTWLDTLERRGYITRTHRQRDNGSRTSDVIQLMMPEEDRGHPKPSNMQEPQEGPIQHATDAVQPAGAAYPESQKEKDRLTDSTDAQKNEREESREKTIGEKAAKFIYDEIQSLHGVKLTGKQFGFFVGEINRLEKNGVPVADLRAGVKKVTEVFPRFQRITVEEAIQQAKFGEQQNEQHGPPSQEI